MKSILFYSMVLIGLIGCGGGGSGGSSSGGTGGTSTTTNNPFHAPDILDIDKQEYLNSINSMRRTARDCGRYMTDASGDCVKDASGNCRKIYDGTDMMSIAPDLNWNDKLYASASEHSADLAAWNHGITIKSEAVQRFKHEGSGGVTDWTSQKLNLGPKSRNRNTTIHLKT